MKIFDKVISKNKTYSIWLEVNDGGIVQDCSCTCVYSSYYGWSKKNRKRKTLCKHILEVITKMNMALPENYLTEKK